MAYLGYYKQLYLLGGVGEALPKDVAIEYAREIDRAANSLISAVQSKVKKKDEPITHVSLTQKSEKHDIENSQK